MEKKDWVKKLDYQMVLDIRTEQKIWYKKKNKCIKQLSH